MSERQTGEADDRAMWALGDYHKVARELIWDLGSELAAACGVTADQRVLDVAAGSGIVAIPAAEAAARVVASELTPRCWKSTAAKRLHGGWIWSR